MWANVGKIIVKKIHCQAGLSHYFSSFYYQKSCIKSFALAFKVNCNLLILLTASWRFDDNIVIYRTLSRENMIFEEK